MNLYINADKLKAKINERLQCNGSFDECGDTAWDYDQGMVAAYNYVLSSIESLQQEQPEVDLEKEIVSICETYGITKHLDAELGPLDIKNIARHFYELGLNTRKEENK